MNLTENIQRIQEIMGLKEQSFLDYVIKRADEKRKEQNPYRNKEYNPENTGDFSDSKVKDIVWRAVEKNTNMNLKENIRRVLREEEKKKDLSVPIKKLVDLYMEKHEDKKYVCGYKFGMGKFAVKNSGERYQRFKITILFNSGYGSKRWPRTMAINTQEEEIMNELQDLILDTFGVIVDIYSTQTPNCKVEDIEKGEQTEGELTEKCWSGYTQKGMKTMFGKRYPNCVKKTK